MQNHYHILIKTERANLSRFMQRLNTSYALYVHYKRGLVGHVLQGRYKAKLVETDEYLVSLSRYIHLNPTKTRGVQALGRAFAMELACRFTRLNQRQIGEHYGNVTSMAVCMARRRFREDDHPERERLRRLLSKLERRILSAPGHPN